jgi:hypothetical protein|tara:strand:+ start:519 stop:899 length:381 start_codon:yes stop_codon:yes gene_type:complete
MALEEIFGMGGGADTAEKPMEEGMEMAAEMEMEESPEAGSLESAVDGMIKNWKPTTPEGERYLAELQDAFSKFGGMEEEEMGEGEMVEGAEEEEASEEPEEEPGPSVGFDIVAMRKRAAKNAMGGE